MKTRKLLFLCFLPAVALLIMGATIRKFSFYEHAPALVGTEIVPLEIPGQSPPYDYTTLAEIRTFSTNGLNPIAYTGNASNLIGVVTIPVTNTAVSTSALYLPSGGPIWFGNGGARWTEIQTSDSRFLGEEAGLYAANVGYVNFIGSQAGMYATNAGDDNFIGWGAGQFANATEYANFIGSFAGGNATNADYSQFIGDNAGANAHSADNSIFIGYLAGQNATSASDSIFAGDHSGSLATSASKSIFLGPYSGTNRANTLWIDTQSTTDDGSYQPLIYGEFDNRMLKINGALTVTNTLTVQGAVNAGIGSLTVAAANTNAAFNCASELQHVHVTAGNVAIEGFANVPAFPLVARVSMTVSNGTAAAIAFFNTAANARMIGSVTSNGIQIASTKMLEVDLKVCSAFTNWAAAAQQ